jgi:hypothetical protein
MGVSADAITDPLTPAQRAQLQPITEVKLPTAEIAGHGTIFVVSHKPNAAFQLVNDALKSGGTVSMSSDPIDTPEGKERGAFIIQGLGAGAFDTLSKKYAVGAVTIAATPTHVLPIKKAASASIAPGPRPSTKAGRAGFLNKAALTPGASTTPTSAPPTSTAATTSSSSQTCPPAS